MEGKWEFRLILQVNLAVLCVFNFRVSLEKLPSHFKQHLTACFDTCMQFNLNTICNSFVIAHFL